MFVKQVTIGKRVSVTFLALLEFSVGAVREISRIALWQCQCLFTMQWIYVMYTTKKYMWCFHWNAWAVDKKILRESLYRSILYRSSLFWNQACHGIVLSKQANKYDMSRNFRMQNVCLKSRTRDVCGRFVVAVHLLTGNVCANGACDRVKLSVVRCVEIRMQRHCEMMQDGVAELLSFLLPSFVNLVFLLMRLAFSSQVSATVVLCHVKLMSGVLSLEVREQTLCSGLCNSAVTSIVYLFTSFLGSDVNVEPRCIVHRVNIHILICTFECSWNKWRLANRYL